MARCLAGNPEPFRRRLLSHGCLIRSFASGLEKFSLAPQSFRAFSGSGFSASRCSLKANTQAANERSEIEPPESRVLCTLRNPAASGGGFLFW